MQPDHYWTNDAGASMEFSLHGSQVRLLCCGTSVSCRQGSTQARWQLCHPTQT